MIKWLICKLWGHKTVHKAFTGEQTECVGIAGNQYTIQLYKWETTKFCTRCGKEVSSAQ